MRRLFTLALLAMLPLGAATPPAHADVCVIVTVDVHACQVSCPPDYKGVIVYVGNFQAVTVCENVV
jgi:hypothetical protein